MNTNAKKVTKYYNSVIASQVKRNINFKDDKFFICAPEEFTKGVIDKKTTNEIFKSFKKKSDNSEVLDIIISAKTIKTEFNVESKKNGDNDELTGVFFIPCKINKEGNLSFDNDSNNLPWIPREFLEPLVESKLAIGDADKLDRFIEDNIGTLHTIETWKDYFEFSRRLYKSCTRHDINDFILKNTPTDSNISLEKVMYIFLDNRVVATRAISRLYDDLQDKKDYNKLYETITETNFKKLEPIRANDILAMSNHFGQMGGEYPLSESQRESLNCFNNTYEGDVLAINGPPGTGKTTLLQSIVANMYVERALEEENPPVIVAASTNNQAVTNIISSFGNIKKVDKDSNFEERWIEKVNSFAVYFPSSSKKSEAKALGFQYTDKQGNDFCESVDNEENIKASTAKFLENCNEYFNENFTDIDKCQKRIHSELLEIEKNKCEILEVASKIENICFPSGIEQCLDNVDCKLNDRYLWTNIEEFLNNIDKEIKDVNESVNNMKNRLNEWEKHFDSLSTFEKLLGFCSSNKKKMEAKNRIFIEPYEDFINESMSYSEIEEIYSYKIKSENSRMKELKGQYDDVNILYDKYNSLLEKFRKLNINIDDKKIKDDFNLEDFNELLDSTVRYKEFWLAVHYFESRWLKKENSLTDKQKGKKHKNIIEQLYTRLALISPCFVMTFFALPRQFYADQRSDNTEFMYNFIDLLIVDEAGQVSPEVAACSFALAKKSIVVGDVYQIEPVWGTNISVAKSLAISNKLIRNTDEFERIDELGMSPCSSSLMQMAAKSCKYQKTKERGLFLKEHRRCYDEIINYCNDLVYNGDLEPLRGPGINDKNNKIKDLPQIGYVQVDSSSSIRLGTSRANKNEATAIALWIRDNIDNIKSAYAGEKEENLFGIIAPFKAQTKYIKNELKKYLSEEWVSKISVGTVHSFQGAEKIIVIMSTVYGSQDGCFFIDSNKNLMNVALSRAKNNFFVFGDINCLGESENSASGLLRKYIKDNRLN